MTEHVSINEIYGTIQGEGQYAGVPAVFVRLQGCSVGCPWCDTKHTWEVADESESDFAIGSRDDATLHYSMTIEQIIAAIDSVFVEWDQSERSVQERMVVVTGGEPYEQSQTGAMLRQLAQRYRVCVETSGTAPIPEQSGGVHITLSPKIGMPGRPFLPQTLFQANEIKLPVGKAKDWEQLHQAANAAGFDLNSVPIYLQPLSASEKATRLCIALCQRLGVRLSLQQHKLINIP